MNRRLLDRIETYDSEVEGVCYACACNVIKVIGSNVTARTDNVRYYYPGENTAMCIYRCVGCQNVIEDTFVPN